jgi:hypothetical protein
MISENVACLIQVWSVCVGGYKNRIKWEKIINPEGRSNDDDRERGKK